jgi:hypothetical protein
MKQNILIFIGYFAYGDYLSLNGMIHFLLNYYDKIIYYTQNPHIKYLKELYNDVLNKIEFYDTDVLNEYIKNNNNYNVFNMCPSFEWNTLFKNVVNDDNNYYCCNNKITNLLDIKSTIKTTNNCSNSLSFYGNNGFDENILLDMFYFKRNYLKEEEYYNDIIKKHNINNEKYIVICELKQNNITLNYDKFINKNLKIINICYLVDIPLYLIKLLENAEEIHMFENSNLLMIYHLQCSNNFNYKGNIYVHNYARNRGENINNMYKNPILNNWIFID